MGSSGLMGDSKGTDRIVDGPLVAGCGTANKLLPSILADGTWAKPKETYKMFDKEAFCHFSLFLSLKSSYFHHFVLLILI